MLRWGGTLAEMAKHKFPCNVQWPAVLGPAEDKTGFSMGTEPGKDLQKVRLLLRCLFSYPGFFHHCFPLPFARLFIFFFPWTYSWQTQTGNWLSQVPRQGSMKKFREIAECSKFFRAGPNTLTEWFLWKKPVLPSRLHAHLPSTWNGERIPRHSHWEPPFPHLSIVRSRRKTGGRMEKISRKEEAEGRSGWAGVLWGKHTAAQRAGEWTSPSRHPESLLYFSPSF